MNILGITQTPPNYARDTSAVLVMDGEVVAAVAEERFSRIKHHAGYPFSSIDYVLSKGNIKKEDIDYLCIPWGSLKKINSFSYALPEMKMAQILNSVKGIRSEQINEGAELIDLKKEFPNTEIVHLDHELSHASSAYRSSGFNKALIIALDGEGVDSGKAVSGGVFIGKKGNIETLELFPIAASFGYFYGSVTEELGFKHCDGEGKTMGLAAYGNPDSCYNELKILSPQINGIKVLECSNKDPKKDIGFGYIGLYDNNFFHHLSNNYIRYLKFRHGKEDLAAASQKILEEQIVELIRNAVDDTGIKNICLAGGVFLNVKVNKKIRELNEVDNIFVYPNAGDGGATLGAALQLYHELTGKKTVNKIEHVYLGPSYSREEIEQELQKSNFKFEYFGEDIPKISAELIRKGKVLGWFQGRAEWGPRALGSRSVLADPRDGKMRERINTVLKKRDWFMPFAPSMLEDRIDSYVENPAPSPFMIQAFDVIKEKQKEIPAVIHIDGTARVHTVKRNVNKRYYDVIDCFQDITGVPLILNTSFNKHGLPIVNTPGDAIEHLKWGCVDVLVIEDFIVYRN